MRARQLTARELLDVGRARVEAKLGGVPEVHEAVLDTLASMYLDVGLDAESAALNGRRVEVLEKLYGSNDLRLIMPLLQQASSTGATAAAASAPALLARAQRILDAAPDPPVQLRVELHRAFANSLRYRDVSAAVAHARAGRELIQKSGVASDDVRRMLYQEALGLQFLGDCEGARRQGEEAHRLTLAQPKTQPRWQIPELTQLYAAATCADDLVRAEEVLREALALTLRVNGPRHIDTAHVQTRLVKLLHDRGRADEADAAQREVDAVLATPAGQHNANLHNVALRNTAWRDLELGRLEQAAPALAELVEREKERDPEGLTLAFALQLQAQAEAALHRHASAAALLERSLAMKRKVLGANALPLAFASLRLDQAALATASGGAAGARNAMAALDALETDLAATPVSGTWPARIAAVRAAAWLALGRREEAAAAAAAGLAAKAASVGEAAFPPLQAELLRRLDQARAAGGKGAS